MESNSPEFVLDRAKYSQLNMQEKRELVQEIARWPKDAPKILLSWTRQELADLISAELGKERKYNGVSKSILIERLLKLISEYTENITEDTIATSPGNVRISSKRQRKKDYPVLPAIGHSDNFSPQNHQNDQVDTLFCQNLACRATLAPYSKFCKRCSCCICFHYDDNKDPSLWLTCGSDSLDDEEDSCGMSCHLNCALKKGRSIVNNGSCTKLEGCLACASCGKVNGIMGSWRKQLLVAKDARRVDVLCQRISLSYQVLKGTEQYKELKDILDIIVKKLTTEVGPIDQVSSEMARGLVSRLSCGSEVQGLCASAIRAIDSLLPDVCPRQNANQMQLSCSIRFEQVSAVSVVLVLEYSDKLLSDFLGCRVWHRKSTTVDYQAKPTYIVLRPEKKFVISNLEPSTEYVFKVSVFSSSKELGVWESLCVTKPSNGNLSSALDPKDEKNQDHDQDQVTVNPSNSQRDSTNSSDDKLAFSDNHSKVRLLEDISKSDESDLPHSSVPPVTPCKFDGTQEVPSSTTKKLSKESNYDYCVRVIRWLERDGYMEKDFRVKFLTWFSLKSTIRDRRVVSAYVDTLIDDPDSLVDQLVDTFMDEISNENKRVQVHPFCKTLWH